MEYEINVTKNGRSYFKAMTDFHHYNLVYLKLKKCFKKEDGYEITVIKWEKVGEFINMED